MGKTMTNSNAMSEDSRVSNCMSNWVCNSVGIRSNTIISDISDITIIIIGMIVDMLGTAIRKVDRVGTFYNTSTIIGLSLVEGSTRVVISNSIGVRVGRGLSKVRLGISTNSMVSNNWGMVDNRSMCNSDRMSNSFWVCNSYSMSKSNSTMKSMSKKSISKKSMCRRSRSCSKDSSKTGKRLKRKNSNLLEFSKLLCIYYLHVVVLWVLIN